MSQAERKRILGYLVISLVGISFALFVHVKSRGDYDGALKHYQQKSQGEAEASAKSIAYSFRQIYQGIRTISLLPGVRNIDRYGKNLDENARAAIVQIYDNMVSNVALSD